jgi:hypothetical protein
MADTSQDRMHPSGWTVDTLKEYFREEFRAIREVMDERDRFYLAQIAEQKNLNENSFESSEKAIEKAEQAQKEYNERSNEFRGQLDDQAKTLMPRPETMSMFKAAGEKSEVSHAGLDAKIAASQSALKDEMTAIRGSFDRALGRIDAEVITLREYRSEGGGKDKAQRDNIQQRNWSIGILIAALFGIMSFVLSVLGYMKK